MSNRLPRKENCHDLVEFVHQRNMVCSLALLEALEKHHGVPVEVVAEPVVEPEPETVLPPIPNELMAEAHEPPPAISIRNIQLLVCRDFDILHSEMLSQRRNKKVVIPRHVAMYLSKKLTPLSLPMIGRKFSFRDHSTIHNAIERVEAYMARDPSFAERVNKLEETLGASLG